MNAKRTTQLSLEFLNLKGFKMHKIMAVFLLIMLFTTLLVVKAQSGPSFTVTFNPNGSAEVGQTVTIHIEVQCNPNCGAAKITPSCGGVDQTENTSGRFDSHWNTSGCQGGSQSVQVCTKSTLDEQWMQGNCQNFAYGLTGSNPSIPTVQFWADTGNLQSGQCTNMHWRTNADSVNIDGNNYGPNGDLNTCPSATRKYSISATGPGGTAYNNFEITVSTVPQPQNQGPTNQTANNPANVQAQPGAPTLAQAAQQDTPGGVHVVNYCAAKGWGGPSNAPDNSPNAAYSWKCGDQSLGDFNQVCKDVFGNDYHSVNVMGPNRLGGWRCVTGGQSNGDGQQNTGNSNPVPHNDNCSPVGGRLHAGDIAVVSNFDPNPLHVYNTASKSSGEIFTVPIYEKVSIISGPKCGDSSTWVEVGYQGHDGWAIEVTYKGFYNLIPNGQPLPGPGGNGGNTGQVQQPVVVNPQSTSDCSDNL